MCFLGHFQETGQNPVNQSITTQIRDSKQSLLLSLILFFSASRLHYERLHVPVMLDYTPFSQAVWRVDTVSITGAETSKDRAKLEVR